MSPQKAILPGVAYVMLATLGACERSELPAADLGVPTDGGPGADVAAPGGADLSTGPAACAPAVMVMTFNIHGARQDIPLANVAGVLRSQQPTVVAFQEVLAAQIDALKAMLSAEGYAYSRHQTTLNIDRGAYGIGFLSKLPLTDVATVELPRCNVPREEPRRILGATFTFGGTPFRVFNTHLQPGCADKQRDKLENYVATPMGRRIIAGDLNTTGIGINGFSDQGIAPGPTYPCPTPTDRIDYLLVSPPVRACGGGPIRLLNCATSDHYPVMAQLAL